MYFLSTSTFGAFPTVQPTASSLLMSDSGIWNPSRIKSSLWVSKRVKCFCRDAPNANRGPSQACGSRGRRGAWGAGGGRACGGRRGAYRFGGRRRTVVSVIVVFLIIYSVVAVVSSSAVVFVVSAVSSDIVVVLVRVSTSAGKGVGMSC